MQRRAAVVGGWLFSPFFFLFLFFFLLKHRRKWGVHTFIDQFWWWFWIRLQGTWPVGDARRGVNVGGRMLALQQRVCEHICKCVCVCFRSSLWMCMFSAEITAPPCKVSRPHPVKIQHSIARCFESKFVLLMFVCLLHKSPPHQITFVCNGAANLSVRLTACEGDRLSSLCLMNFLLQS